MHACRDLTYHWSMLTETAPLEYDFSASRTAVAHQLQFTCAPSLSSFIRSTLVCSCKFSWWLASIFSSLRCKTPFSYSIFAACEACMGCRPPRDEARDEALLAVSTFILLKAPNCSESFNCSTKSWQNSSCCVILLSACASFLSKVYNAV